MGEGIGLFGKTSAAPQTDPKEWLGVSVTS